MMSRHVSWLRVSAVDVLALWALHSMQRTRVQTLDAYRKYSQVLHGVHDAIRDLVVRCGCM